MMRLILITCILFFMSGMEAQPRYKVYVFMAEECPVCLYMSRSLSSLEERYGDDVSFFAVFPLKNSNYKKIHLFKEENDLGAYESILDSDQELVRAFGARVTPEVVVTDLQDNVLYQGRISNDFFAPGKFRHGPRQNDLEMALEKILAGQEVPRPWPKPVGCYITLRRS